ncbi:hypothetical protein FOZ62_009357, partial [Perkinsus olseni]
MRGFNGCLFAYGQTGSGKSYTMAGCDMEEGIIPRINGAIFSAEATAKLQQIRVWVSYLEIYNEHLHDLLADSSQAGKDLSVMEHPSLGVYVKGATEVVVRSEEDIERMLEYGLKRRAEGATNMNAHSSRSHAVFRIKLECKHRAGPTVSSRVNLIDLAGSERQGKTGATGIRLKSAPPPISLWESFLYLLSATWMDIIERGSGLVQGSWSDQSELECPRDGHKAA